MEDPVSKHLAQHCPGVTNYRGWDYEQILEHGEFKSTDVVLDTGALHTYFCVYLAQHVEQVRATDNYSWAKRAYMSEQELPPPPCMVPGSARSECRQGSG